MVRTQLTVGLVFAISSIGGDTLVGARQAQSVPAEEQLKQLVVMIQSGFGEETGNGAGILFARQANRLYVVTANHTVRRGVEQADRVKVQFRWLPGDWSDARLLQHEDRDLDIAVLSVTGDALDIPNLAWNSWSPPDSLAAGDRLRPIGYPLGVSWFTPQQRHLFHSATPLYIRSEGELVPGNSGGALVTEDWGIVGIASQADRPFNRFARIDRAVEKLREWGYRIDLAPKTQRSTTQSTAPQPTKIQYEAPRVTKDIQPRYPDEAKASRVQGTVELTCVVAINGRAIDITVVKPLHPRLDEAAVEALKQWEFTPASKFGEPVPAKMTVEMTFSLK